MCLSVVGLCLLLEFRAIWCDLTLSVLLILLQPRWCPCSFGTCRSTPVFRAFDLSSALNVSPLVSAWLMSWHPSSFLLLKALLVWNSCSDYPKIAPLSFSALYHAFFLSWHLSLLFILPVTSQIKWEWKLHENKGSCAAFVLLAAVSLVLRFAGHVGDSENVWWVCKSLGAQVCYSLCLKCFVCLFLIIWSVWKHSSVRRHIPLQVSGSKPLAVGTLYYKYQVSYGR